MASQYFSIYCLLASSPDSWLYRLCLNLINAYTCPLPYLRHTCMHISNLTQRQYMKAYVCMLFCFAIRCKMANWQFYSDSQNYWGSQLANLLASWQTTWVLGAPGIHRLDGASWLHNESYCILK